MEYSHRGKRGKVVGKNMQKMTFLKRDFFSAGPGNHCFSKKMIQTKVPDEDKIRAVLKVKEFPGFVTGKVTKNGFPLVASWVGHPVSGRWAKFWWHSQNI